MNITVFRRKQVVDLTSDEIAPERLSLIEKMRASNERNQQMLAGQKMRLEVEIEERRAMLADTVRGIAALEAAAKVLEG